MAKKFKLKYLLIAFSLILILTVCMSVSISYSAWTSNNGKDAVNANVGTGKWENITSFPYDNGISFSGGSYELDENNCNAFNFKGKTSFILYVNSGEQINFYIESNMVTTIRGLGDYITTNDNGVVTFNQSGYYEVVYYEPNDYMPNCSCEIEKLNGTNAIDAGQKVIDLTKNPVEIIVSR